VALAQDANIISFQLLCPKVFIKKKMNKRGAVAGMTSLDFVCFSTYAQKFKFGLSLMEEKKRWTKKSLS
jgi:hypothetical protein